MRLVSDDRSAIRERRPTIASPGELIYPRGASNPLDAETGSEPSAHTKILDELLYSD